MIYDGRQSCPLCKETNTHPIEGIDSPKYLMCPTCSLIFMQDKYIMTAAKEKERYDQHQNNLENEGYVNMMETFLQEAVLPYLSTGERILDFGSGPGPVLQTLLQAKGYETDIYDPYYAPDRVYAGKVYDVITCTETIEHIEDPMKAMGIFVEHLKNGGKLAIMTLFHTGVETFPQWWYRRDPTHIRFYHPETFHWIEDHFPLKVIEMNKRNIVVFEKASKSEE